MGKQKHSTSTLLAASLRAFNEIPNKRVTGLPGGLKDTYEIASSLGRITPPVKLNAEQVHVLRGMNKYWEEISTRDEPRRTECAINEMDQMCSVLSRNDILLIVGDYAKNYPDE